MLQLTPQMRIFLAVEPCDFRKGVDGLAAVCRNVLKQDPFSGYVFVFHNKRRTSFKLLCYDGHGFWLCMKRLSKGRFRPLRKPQNKIVTPLIAHELQILLLNGDPQKVAIPPPWRPLEQ